MLVLFTLIFACDPGVTDTSDPIGADTCTSGDTMTNPGVASSSATEVVVGWEPGTGLGAELPDAYFEAVTVDARSDDAIEVAVSAVDYESPRAVRVSASAFPDGTHALVLAFPDRRDHVDCAHPGMEDVYWLRATLSFADGALTASAFEQGVDLGDI